MNDERIINTFTDPKPKELIMEISPAGNLTDMVAGFTPKYKTPVSLDRQPLVRRLIWTVNDPDGREGEATRRRISSTDQIRGKLIRLYHNRGLDLLTQMRLIHRAHMRSNEHIILDPDQALTTLTANLERVDRLAGVLRSPAGLSVKIGLGDLYTLCASNEDAPFLTANLAHKAESLFPLVRPNPDVTEENIYQTVSAIQYVMVMTHPFYEANARTSEDFTLTLWQRRPDLSQLKRYLSPDGTRESPNVDRAGEIIDLAATQVLQNISIDTFGVDQETAKGFRRYPDLQKYLKNLGIEKEASNSIYQEAFCLYLAEFIDKIGTPELLTDSIINQLALNLSQSSTEYQFQS